MARLIALTALVALGFSDATFHEPFHADGTHRPITVTERSDRNPPQWRCNLKKWLNRTGHPACPLTRAGCHRVISMIRKMHGTDRQVCWVTGLSSLARAGWLKCLAQPSGVA